MKEKRSRRWSHQPNDRYGIGVWNRFSKDGSLFCGDLFALFSFNFSKPYQRFADFACIYGFFWALTGNDPNQFFERWKKPKKYLAEEPALDFNRAGIPVPAKPKRLAITYRIKKEKSPIPLHRAKISFCYLRANRTRRQASRLLLAQTRTATNVRLGMGGRRTRPINDEPTVCLDSECH
ncbi:MAG: hypothetical protein HC820_10130 [Hydrococcus sp. RM1_1_31]|nr:hypothetical protein [Hydrococcus sp. RM1_1_31]